MDLISQGAIRAGTIIWRPGPGALALTVVCKATFELQFGVSFLAATQEPIIEADVLSSPGGSLLLASDLVPFKKRPEVLVVGHAYARDERPVQSLMTRLVVGELDKSILVVGDRYVGVNGQLGEPSAFTRMPLVWERAAGGPGTENPAGVPTGNAARAELFRKKIPAPNLLPRGTDIQSSGDVIAPAGFGPIAPLWPSRAAHLHRHAAGWDPSRWHERPLPPDIDFAYMNTAPADQQRTATFGDETLYLEGLHPRFASLSTQLVPVTPVATIDRGSGPEPLKLRGDTLVIDTDRGLAMLVWRAHVVLEHPERPMRVVVSAPGTPDVGPPPSKPRTGVPVFADPKATFVPTGLDPSGPVLPFSSGGGAAAVMPRSGNLPAPASNDKTTTTVLKPWGPTAAFGGGGPPTSRPADPPAPAINDKTTTQPLNVLSWLTASQPPTQTHPPGLLPKAAPLPFPQTRQASEPPRFGVPPAGAAGLPFGAPPIEIPPSTPAPKFGVPPPPPPGAEPTGKTEPAVWQQRPPETPQPPPSAPPGVFGPPSAPFNVPAPPSAPFGGLGPASAPAPEPPQPPVLAPLGGLAPASAPAPETPPNAPPEPDATEARLRLIQRAIWKGERPIQEILAEHNLTEVEWRAMKRAFTRRDGA